MKLKIDENGNAVLEKGLPVYVQDDGKELAFDATDAVSKITTYTSKIESLTQEKNRHFAKKNELQKLLDPFEGIDAEKAKTALETVANLDTKKIVDAGEMEALKKQMNQIAELKETALNKEISTLTATIAEAESVNHNLLVTSEFAKSEFFAGEKPKTILPPDIASEHFGKNFKIEGLGADAKMVGYLGGEKILSREDPGELATFNEAIGVIIDAYPMKDRILATTSGGSGSIGGTGHKPDLPEKTISSSDQPAINKNIDKIAKGEVTVQMD